MWPLDISHLGTLALGLLPFLGKELWARYWKKADKEEEEKVKLKQEKEQQDSKQILELKKLVEESLRETRSGFSELRQMYSDQFTRFEVMRKDIEFLNRRVDKLEQTVDRLDAV